MPTIKPTSVVAINVEPAARQTGYPEPFASRVKGRQKRRLGDVFGLANFGVNLTRLEPGAVSSVRHSHTRQDEFIYVLEGTPTLVTNTGSELLQPGMCAGFCAGSNDAHHLRNDSGSDVLYLEVGDRTPNDSATYPDDDLAVTSPNGMLVFTRKDGSPFK